MNTRHDLYRHVHKGLRRELGSLLASAGSTDPTSAAALQALNARFRSTFRLLDAHHHHEDDHLGPHLARLAPALFADMEREHTDFARDAEILTARAAQLATASSKTVEVELAGFYLALSTFVARYFLHMHAEETDYNAVFQAHFDDQELQAIEIGLVQSIEPSLFASFLDVMLPAMNPVERARLGGPSEAEVSRAS